MTTIIFPSNTTEIIDEIRGAVGRSIIINIPTLHTCPVCTLDPVTNQSTNPFCIICGGNYWIASVSGYIVSGHVTWGNTDTMLWNTGGKLWDGDCRVQIKFTSENIYAVVSGVNFEVDNKVLTVQNYILRGTPTVNRILVDLKERDKNV
jgi:hypothetical protein